MFVNLPRRKRQLLYISAVLCGAALLSFLFIGGRGSDQGKYIPGQQVEGLTMDLARSIPKQHPDLQFTDVSVASGLRFRHFNRVRTSQLPEDMGSGAAWGDYDNDGWEDLFVVNQAGTADMTQSEMQRSGTYSHLYHNNGDGTFTDRTALAGIDHRQLGMAAAWGDFNNDGWLDLAISGYGRNSLYKNKGDGIFEDVTEPAGLSAYQGFWTGVAWGDYNRDGNIDLYVTGYVRYTKLAGIKGGSAGRQGEEPAGINPSSFPPERNLLFTNQGDGTFREGAKSAGISNPGGRSLSAVWCDFDDDGWQDLYVANDVSDNMLYHNRRDGTFEEISHAARIADYRGAMGLATGDWDGDADTDLFITHWIAEENALYTNQLQDNRFRGRKGLTGLRFTDEASRTGLGQLSLDYIGWGTSFVDLDNDGRLDLFVVNGSTLQKADAPRQLVGMQDLVLWNGGKEDGFYDLSTIAGSYFKEELVGRGAAFADYDRDGDVDVFIVNHNEPGVLLRNDTGGSGHWMELRLRSKQRNLFALGARIKIVAGSQRQIRKVGSQGPYLSQNSIVQHIGLGKAERVDSLEIYWPDGSRQVLLDLKADRQAIVQEGSANGLQDRIINQTPKAGS